MAKIPLKEAKQQIEWALKTMSAADYTPEEAAKDIAKKGSLYGWGRKLSYTNDRIIWDGQTFVISKAAGRWVVRQIK